MQQGFKTTRHAKQDAVYGKPKDSKSFEDLLAELRRPNMSAAERERAIRKIAGFNRANERPKKPRKEIKELPRWSRPKKKANNSTAKPK